MIISWTAPFFPQIGVYNIYHTDKVNKSIIQVTSSGATIIDQSKYAYNSRPFTSTYINFIVRDITRDDAGYYNGGRSQEAAWSGGGVVLIVYGESHIIIYGIDICQVSTIVSFFPETVKRSHLIIQNEHE